MHPTAKQEEASRIRAIFGDLDSVKVTVRRHWQDYRLAEVPLSKLWGFHIDLISGGVGVPSPHPMLYAYMWCTDLPKGIDFAHSCRHGPPPHPIKVCITQAGNDRAIYRALRRLVEPSWGKRNRPRQVG